ncbi:MAG: hepatitis A virus cellular receptor 1 [Prevotella sp.]|nr:hepatitis A virus cellular receptor 1 [Prevotella sp.]
MKQMTSLLAMVMVVLLSATVTSCDPDDDIAYTLEGTWKGYMGVYRDYDNRDYGSTYTELYFERDPYRYSSGRGYWVDYYKEHPWSSRNYVASRISWTVSSGVIYVNFVDEGTRIEIRDYALNDGVFSGCIYYGNTTVEFHMRHVDSPNWDSYYFEDDYGNFSKPALGAWQPLQAEPRRQFGYETK